MRLLKLILTLPLLLDGVLASPAEHIDPRHAVAKPSCNVVGYDHGRFIVNKRQCSVAECAQACAKTPKCKSYGYGKKTCRLYSKSVKGNVKCREGSPYKFWDKSCPRPQTHSTRKTTSKKTTTRKTTTKCTTKTLKTTTKCSTTTKKPAFTTTSKPVSSSTSLVSTSTRSPTSSSSTSASTLSAADSTTSASAGPLMTSATLHETSSGTTSDASTTTAAEVCVNPEVCDFYGSDGVPKCCPGYHCVPQFHPIGKRSDYQAGTCQLDEPSDTTSGGTQTTDNVMTSATLDETSSTTTSDASTTAAAEICVNPNGGQCNAQGSGDDTRQCCPGYECVGSGDRRRDYSPGICKLVDSSTTTSEDLQIQTTETTAASTTATEDSTPSCTINGSECLYDSDCCSGYCKPCDNCYNLIPPTCAPAVTTTTTAEETSTTASTEDTTTATTDATLTTTTADASSTTSSAAVCQPTGQTCVLGSESPLQMCCPGLACQDVADPTDEMHGRLPQYECVVPSTTTTTFFFTQSTTTSTISTTSSSPNLPPCSTFVLQGTSGYPGGQYLGIYGDHDEVGTFPSKADADVYGLATDGTVYLVKRSTNIWTAGAHFGPVVLDPGFAASQGASPLICSVAAPSSSGDPGAFTCKRSDGSDAIFQTCLTTDPRELSIFNPSGSNSNCLDVGIVALCDAGDGTVTSATTTATETTTSTTTATVSATTTAAAMCLVLNDYCASFDDQCCAGSSCQATMLTDDGDIYQCVEDR